MGIVEDYPLALCDARSATVDDLVSISQVDKGFVRHSFMAKYSKDFRFCYLENMRNDEVCIFKVFDSKDGVAQSGYPYLHVASLLMSALTGVPHSSFNMKTHSSSAKPRESIEVRLIFLSALD